MAGTLNICVIYTGRGYPTADRLPSELTLPEGATTADAFQVLNEHLPPASPLSGTCLLAINGEHLGTISQHSPRTLRDRDELLLIAPVAGG